MLIETDQFLDASPDDFLPCLGCAENENFLGRIFWVDPYGKIFCLHCSPPFDPIVMRRRLILEPDENFQWIFREWYPRIFPPLEPQGKNLSKQSQTENLPEPTYRLVDAEKYFEAQSVIERFLEFGRGKR